MNIYLASDHAGFELKEKIKTYLNDMNIVVTDCGALELNADDDYPMYISEAARAVSLNQNAKAIILGGSGQGEAIVANRFTGVRAVVFYGGPLDIITLSRQHNDANVLSLGARFLTDSQAFEAVSLWLSTEFSEDERHARRITQIEEYSHI